jgi:hypothetical protein
MGIKRYKLDEFKELKVKVIRLKRRVIYTQLILLVFFGLLIIQDIMHGC